MKNFNKNVIWSIFSQVSNFGLQFAFTIFLARIILPYEYGVMGQAQTITAFFIIFADGGIVWSIVREKDIKHEEVINLFWINAFLGVLLFGLCWLSAPLVGAFYGIPEVTAVLRATGFVFIFTGLSTPFSMWLKKNMEFKKIALINLSSVLVSGLLALIAAVNGFGVWALVILGLVKGGVLLLLLLIFARMPLGRYDFKTPVKHLLQFGAGLIGFGAVNYFAQNMDKVLIGKFDGAEALAYYTKAYFLMFLPNMLITGALTGLMVSVLAKLQDDTAQFERTYAKVLRLIFVVTFPVAGYFLFFPADSIFVLYGSNWDGSVHLLQILSIAAITQPLYDTQGWIYTAVGKSKAMFHWGIFSSVVLVISFFIGAHWGAMGIAVSYSLVMGILLVYVGLNRVYRLSGIRFQYVFRHLVPIAVIGLIALLLVKLIFIQIEFKNLYLQVMVKVALLLLTYFMLLYATFRKQFISLFKIQDVL